MVAIIAVPIALTASGSDAPETPAPEPGSDSASIAPEGQSAVLAYDPGLRDYRERLDALTSKDPFEQQFQAPEVDAAALEGTTLSGSGAGGSGAVSVSSGGGGSGTSGASSTSGTSSLDVGGDADTGARAPGARVTQYLFYEADVSVGLAGEAKRRNDISELTVLPSEQTPVVIYLGASITGEKAVFLVSSDVDTSSGEGVCALGVPPACQVLVLRPGEARWFVYGLDGKTYVLRLLRLDRVVSDTLPG
jgi:hypothetical protein